MGRTLTCFYRISPLATNSLYLKCSTCIAINLHQKPLWLDLNIKKLLIKGIVYMECFWYMKPTLSQSVLRSSVQADNIANQDLTFARLPESSNCKTYHNEYINPWIIYQAHLIFVTSISSSASVKFLTEGNFSYWNQKELQYSVCILHTLCNFTHIV